MYCKDKEYRKRPEYRLGYVMKEAELELEMQLATYCTVELLIVPFLDFPKSLKS